MYGLFQLITYGEDGDSVYYPKGKHYQNTSFGELAFEIESNIMDSDEILEAICRREWQQWQSERQILLRLVFKNNTGIDFVQFPLMVMRFIKPRLFDWEDNIWIEPVCDPTWNRICHYCCKCRTSFKDQSCDCCVCTACDGCFMCERIRIKKCAIIPLIRRNMKFCKKEIDYILRDVVVNKRSAKANLIQDVLDYYENYPNKKVRAYKNKYNRKWRGHIRYYR